MSSMQPMITRTLRGSDVQLLCLSQETGKLFDVWLFVPGRYNSTDSPKLRKAIDALHRLPNHVQIVQIQSVKKVSRKYHMSESTFIKNADLVTNDMTEETENTEN